MTPSRSVFASNQDLPFSESLRAQQAADSSDVLSQWLPATAKVLEVGSGSGQTMPSTFCRQLSVQWQPSETAPENLAGLAAFASIFERGCGLWPGPAACSRFVGCDRSGRPMAFSPLPGRLFSANTAHIHVPRQRCEVNCLA